MYQASARRYAKVPRNLDATLAKTRGHATATKIDPAVFMSARVFPDMLHGTEFPRYVHTEQSFDDSARMCFGNCPLPGRTKLGSAHGPRMRVMCFRRLLSFDTGRKARRYLLRGRRISCPRSRQTLARVAERNVAAYPTLDRHGVARAGVVA